MAFATLAETSLQNNSQQEVVVELKEMMSQPALLFQIGAVVHIFVISEHCSAIPSALANASMGCHGDKFRRQHGPVSAARVLLPARSENTE